FPGGAAFAKLALVRSRSIIPAAGSARSANAAPPGKSKGWITSIMSNAVAECGKCVRVGTSAFLGADPLPLAAARGATGLRTAHAGHSERRLCHFRQCLRELGLGVPKVGEFVNKVCTLRLSCGHSAPRGEVWQECRHR